MHVFRARDEYPRDDTGGHHLFGCVDGRQEAFVESFETYRPYLFSIAYRMLGSAMDAEDLGQETYLRSQATEPATIRSLKAFLTTIICSLCMDLLQIARMNREVYVGTCLTEP